MYLHTKEHTDTTWCRSVVSFNASAVKIYSAPSILMRFENTTIFFNFEKTVWLITTMALYIVENSEVEGFCHVPYVYI
jgi:hypothetical protein